MKIEPMQMPDEIYSLTDYLGALKPLIFIFLGMSLAQVHAVVSIISLLVGVGYALRKWYLMEKNVKNKKHEK